MPQLKVEKICPVCLSNKKKKVKLKILRMNFSQGIVVCPTKDCPYPLVEDVMDDFVTFDDRPEIDPSAGTEVSSVDSWGSILEQINKIITPVNESVDVIKQADQSTDNLVQENGLDEFSSYASDFIDSFVKECELKYSKSNEDLREPPSFDLENKSMNTSMLEFDLNLSSLSISTLSGEAFGALDALTNFDCLNDSGMQTEPDVREESNSRNNTAADCVGKNLVLENPSKNNNNEYSAADVVKSADTQTKPAKSNSSNTTVISEGVALENNAKNTNNENNVNIFSNDGISELLNELQNNSRLEPVHLTRENSLISPDASSNKANSQHLSMIGSNKASTGKTCKLSCGTGNTLGKTISDDQSCDTSDTQPDELNIEMSPAGNCELNNQAINYDEMEFIYLPEEMHVSTENQLPLVRKNEIEQQNSIVIIFDASGSSSVVQFGDIAGVVNQGNTNDTNRLVKDHQKVCEVDDIAVAVKQGNVCDSNGLEKDGQKVHEVVDIAVAAEQGNVQGSNGLKKDRQKVCDVDDIAVAVKKGNVRDSNCIKKDCQKVCEVDDIASPINQGNINDTNGLKKDHQKVCEIDDITHAMKQANLCNTTSPIKDHGKVCVVSLCCLQTIYTNTDASTAGSASGKGGTSVQNWEGQSSTEKDDSRLLNRNRLTEVDVNDCSMNPSASGIEKFQNLSACKPLQDSVDSQHLPGCSKENASTSSVGKTTPCKAKRVTTKNVKNTSPQVLVKTRMCSRSAIRKQINSPNSNNSIDCKNDESGNGNSQNNINGKGSLSNINSKNTNKERNTSIISQMPNEPQNDSLVKKPLDRDPGTTGANEADVDCIPGDKSDTTLDLPFKHISDAVVSDGSSTLEQSLFSLILDDLELPSQKTEFSTSYNRYSTSYKSALIDPKSSSAGMKDDFVVRKPQWKCGFDRSRRKSTRNIKTSSPISETSIREENNTGESVTPDELPSTSTVDDCNIDKPVLTVTVNSGMEDDFHFLLRKSQWKVVVDCSSSRRRSTRNIKTSSPISGTSSIPLNDKMKNKSEELESSNPLPSLFTIDDDYIDQPVVKMTENSVLENSNAGMKDDVVRKKRLCKVVVDYRTRNSNAAMKDDFVLEKPQCKVVIEHSSRRQRTRNIKTSTPIRNIKANTPIRNIKTSTPIRNIKANTPIRNIKTSTPIRGTSSVCLNDKKENETEESESPDPLPSIFTIDGDDQPVTKVASNGDAKNVKNQPDNTYKHINYTYSENSYQTAKVVKSRKYQKVTQSSELVLTRINKILTKKI